MNTNMNKSYVSAENTPGQAASNPARHSSQQTSDVHSFGGPEEEVASPAPAIRSLFRDHP